MYVIQNRMTKLFTMLEDTKSKIRKNAYHAMIVHKIIDLKV
jgi:hypothetical protein